MTALLLLTAPVTPTWGVTIPFSNRGGDRSEVTAEQRNLMCQIAATAGSLRGTLPSAWLGKERAMRVVQSGASDFARLTKGVHDMDASLSSIHGKAAHVIQGEEVIARVQRAIQSLRDQSAQILEFAEDVFSGELVDDAPPVRFAAASRLVMLTQRLGKSAAEFNAGEVLDSAAAFLLDKDVKSFDEILDAMVNGNKNLRLKPAHTSASRQRLKVLGERWLPMREQANILLSNLAALASIRNAEVNLSNELLLVETASWNVCVKGIWN